MAQVSRNILSKKAEQRIYEIFVEVIASINKPTEIDFFLNDLLSPTEKIMLGKRLTIAYLLLKGYDQRSICQIVKVSLGTVSKVSTNLQIKGQGYKGVMGKVFAKEKITQILEKLDSFLTELIPPPKGTNWSRIKREHYENKRIVRKPF